MVTDIGLAREYIDMRLSAEGSFSSAFTSAYADAVNELVRIAYSYGVDGRAFWFGMSPSMQSEVDSVIEALKALLADWCYTLAEVGEEDLEQRERLSADYEAYGGFEGGLDLYLLSFRKEVESLIACAMLLGLSPEDAVSDIVEAKRKPWLSTLWKEGLALAGVHSVMAEILRNGGVTYGRGRGNVSFTLLDTYGRGYVAEAWMDTWLTLYGEGKDYFRSFVMDSTACGECKAEEAKGWQKIADYPSGGYHPNCRCMFIFADAEDVEVMV